MYYSTFDNCIVLWIANHDNGGEDNMSMEKFLWSRWQNFVGKGLGDGDKQGMATSVEGAIPSLCLILPVSDISYSLGDAALYWAQKLMPENWCRGPINVPKYNDQQAQFTPLPQEVWTCQKSGNWKWKFVSLWQNEWPILSQVHGIPK